MSSSPGSRPAASPPSGWRIGTEHEKFLFLHRHACVPCPTQGPRGVRALMESLIARFGWLPIMEGDNIIALKRPDGEAGGTVSLEPGGQFELSGDPLRTVHEVGAETHDHLSQCLDVGSPMGIGFLGVGFSPNWTQDETPRMPKQRYQVMTRYMPMVGKRGLDMMYRTATIQVNLDFADEADMVKKFRVSLALQPVATAIFACSPFTEGKPNGFLSMRSEVWRDTDPNRTGMLPFVFEPGMSFERYVDYALAVPMYFVYRGGRYIDVAGSSFRRFPRRTTAAAAGRVPDRGRLVGPPHHALSRGAHEAVPGDARRRRRALAAHLRASGAVDGAALRLRPRSMRRGTWSRTGAPRSGRRLRDAVPKTALRTPFRRTTVLELARQVLAIAQGGLQRRAFANAKGEDESIFLEPVEAILRNGLTPAEEILARYEGEWGRSTDPLFREYAF